MKLTLVLSGPAGVNNSCRTTHEYKFLPQNENKSCASECNANKDFSKLGSDVCSFEQQEVKYIFIERSCVWRYPTERFSFPYDDVLMRSVAENVMIRAKIK